MTFHSRNQLASPHQPTPTNQHSLDSQRGQATTEYALILLVAAVIASLVIAWATVGGGSGRIGELFDTIFEGVLQRAEPGSE